MRRLTGSEAAALRRRHPEGEFTRDSGLGAQPVAFEEGELLFREGTEPRQLFYLPEGRVVLTTSFDDGRRADFCVLPGPAFFGELELLSVQFETAEVTALSRCLGYSISSADAARLFEGDPVFLRALCRYLARRTAVLSRRLLRSQTLPLRSLLAEFVLASASGGVYRVTDERAAAYLGVSARRVNALMGELRGLGMLQKRGQSDIVADAHALEAEARL